MEKASHEAKFHDGYTGENHWQLQWYINDWCGTYRRIVLIFKVVYKIIDVGDNWGNYWDLS